MSFDLADVFRHMQPFAMAIVAVLAVMAMASLSVFVERLWVYYKSRKTSRKFAAKAGGLLERQDHDALIKLADEHKASHLASLIAGGMRTYVAARKQPGEVPPLELTRRELERKSEAVSADVRRGHSILASVGSVGPFVGLLGTVIGIISAFQGIAAEGSGGLSAVSAGIAEALIVTAIGLIVAIPSVLAFNMLSGKSDALLLALGQSKGEFLDYLENKTGSGATGAGAG
ncbi:MAG: MotA/TolQ/ExbB proton channel family protein, partial [Myxococcales bacterium]|nr:MotA/TolQ/ExbB proton channel family protein [Myxococcales bacterium]